MTTAAAPAGPDRARWAATVRELVQLRREEAAQEEAAENAMADELRRVFSDQPSPLDGVAYHRSGRT